MKYFAVMHTDGALGLKDIVEDCRNKHWVPILLLRSNIDASLLPKIPLFRSQQTARRFSQRNLPGDWLYGEFGVDDQDLEKFQELNWNWELFDFPFKVSKNESIDVEVYDLTHYTSLDVTVLDRNVCQVLASDDV